MSYHTHKYCARYSIPRSLIHLGSLSCEEHRRHASLERAGAADGSSSLGPVTLSTLGCERLSIQYLRERESSPEGSPWHIFRDESETRPLFLVLSSHLS